ncbi:hypothetical protein HK102_013296 [Quaeritorhiza haematococci]|nr:hypothetical protein HK102_013296 [Quaeritorhiza haematococci]
MHKELKHEVAQAKRKSQDAALRTTKTNLREHSLQTKRMQVRQELIEKEVDKYFLKKREKEEKIAQEIYAEYVKKQRKAIIEKRKTEKEERAAKDAQLKMQQESRERLYPSLTLIIIQILSEQLAEAKREEELVNKAHAEEMRKLAREEKQKIKDQIQLIKEKLAVDEVDSYALQQSVASRLADQIHIGFVPKSKGVTSRKR